MSTAPQKAQPLVSVGIPAYNRPDGLRRAAASALGQSYPTVEVVISDDASSDPGVGAVIDELSADHRVRAMRQARNLGHAGNYQWVLEAARGDYFMWLADDDWIDPSYVERCVAALEADPAVALVCGLARYYRAGAEVVVERPTELRSPRVGIRVVRFFTGVTMNGALFGIARRDDLTTVGGFPAEVGGDWLLVGAMAGRGAIHTLSDVHIHRSAEGLGGDNERLARGFGLSGLRARRHHLFSAARIWRLIMRGPPLFPRLALPERLIVATAAAASIVVRFTVADAVRTLLGAQRAQPLEARVSAWLRRHS